MTITIKLDTGNAAFEVDPIGELERILIRFMVRAKYTASLKDCTGALQDSNGNTVGSVTVTGQ